MIHSAKDPSMVLLRQQGVRGPDTYRLPFEIDPTIGKHDYNTCEKCSIGLKEMTKSLQKMFAGNKDKKAFPFCCSGHSNLVHIAEFDRKSFIGVPEMVARKIIYTNQHIVNNYQSQDWYKQITDFIEWVVMSFGAMPKDCGEPLFLKGYFDKIIPGIENETNFPKEKRSRILQFIQSIRLAGSVPNTDINILLATYQKWLKIFPFKLNNYFGHLKEKFEKELPFLNGMPDINIYSGLTKLKLHTKESLIEALIRLTDRLLKEMSGTVLLEKGIVPDANKIQVELILQERRTELERGYTNSSPSEEHRYIKILKAWFGEERSFWSKLMPLLNQENDWDFIKGHVDLEFTPQGESGFFIISKGEIKKKFTIERYFDLDLANWEFEIDKALTKKEKIGIANNAIFKFRKDWLTWDYPVIQTLKEKSIQHLYYIIEYINNNYTEYFPTQPAENIHPEKQLFDIVETYLFPLKAAFNHEADYLKAVAVVKAFFSSRPIRLNSALFVKNGNTKNLAFALGEIWRSKRNEIISYEYLQFYKQAFSIFNSQNLDKDNFFSNNLYKYSISKT